MLYKVGECIFLLFFFFPPLPTVVPWCSHTLPAFTYNEHTAAINFPPSIFRQRAFKENWVEASNQPSLWVFMIAHAITWPWYVLGCLTEPQKHVNTWTILQRETHLLQDVCINPRDECLPDVVAIELLRARGCALAKSKVSSLVPWVKRWPCGDMENTTLRWNAIKLKSVWMYCLLRKTRLQSNI